MPCDAHSLIPSSPSQVPISVAVSDDLCSGDADKASAELTTALVQAHAKSGNYAQQKMKEVYEDLGLSPNQAGPP